MNSRQPRIPLSLESPGWYEHAVGSEMLLLPFDSQQLNRRWLWLGGENPETTLLARLELAPVVSRHYGFVD